MPGIIITQVCSPLFFPQKAAHKTGGGPKPLRVFCRPTHSNTPLLYSLFSYFLRSNENVYTIQLFQNPVFFENLKDIKVVQTA
ncbi:MAG: hypothetical protein WKI04_10025, partial [Ferruginibacter sp.]